MKVGKLADEQLLYPSIRSYYSDIIRKNLCIAYRADTLNTIHKDLLGRLPKISENDNTILAGEISDCFEKIYSCMEYAASILKEILRERGTLESSYHKILKKTIKNTDTASIYCDKKVKNFVMSTLDWYAIVHDIRSEETHFSMGKIYVVNSVFIYKIQRKTGRETVYDLIRVIKKLPGQTDSQYSLNVDDVKRIYLGFLNSIRYLETIISKKGPLGI